MAGEEGGAKKRAVTESLGWLTESSIMPKKRRAIEGVGVSSLLELKAQLYKSQEDSKKSKELSGPDLEYQRAKNKISTKDSFSLKNRGVDARAHKYVCAFYCYTFSSFLLFVLFFKTMAFCGVRDKLELKAVRDGSVSYAALERKAQLYDKLVNGELSDEEDQEKYCVDFFRKGIEQDELPLPPSPPRRDLLLENEDGAVNGGADDDDSLMFNVKSVGPGRTAGAGAVDSADYKRNIRYGIYAFLLHCVI